MAGNLMRVRAVVAALAALLTACAGSSDRLQTPSGVSTVPPGVSGSTYSFAIGETTFTADGPTGRVTGMSFRGTNLLIGSEVNKVTYGSSFWTSPQTWSWPPAIDAALFTHRIDRSSQRIVFDSGEVIVSDHPLSIQKQFWADARRNAIAAEYTVTNRGSQVLRFAPWQVTRVASEGLVFYPRGAADPAGQTRRGAPRPISAVTIVDGIVWYDFTGNDSQTKSVGDGAEGWLAYVANGVLLLQSFVDIPAAAPAEGEGEVEVYTAPNNTLVELEPQGAAVDLAPGSTSEPWRTYWYVRAVPPGMDVSLGSKALVNWVRSVLP
ncbi:MAG: DUF4380 domain-containing protein [Pseudomonadota bacterium]